MGLSQAKSVLKSIQIGLCEWHDLYGIDIAKFETTSVQGGLRYINRAIRNRLPRCQLRKDPMRLGSRPTAQFDDQGRTFNPLRQRRRVLAQEPGIRSAKPILGEH